MTTAADLIARKQPRRTVVAFDDGTTITVQACGRRRYHELATAPEHQPTREQRAEFTAGLDQLGAPKSRRPRLGYNPDTFPPALLAECAVDPPLTLDDATALWHSDAWSVGELAALLEALVAVNTTTGAGTNEAD